MIGEVWCLTKILPHTKVGGHVVEPRQLPPAADDLSVLRVPEGFTVNVFARERAVQPLGICWFIYPIYGFMDEWR